LQKYNDAKIQLAISERVIHNCIIQTQNNEDNMKHLDEASQRQASQEHAENYVESIFMHTGEAVETFINYFELDFEHGVMSPIIIKMEKSVDGFDCELERVSNGQLLSLLLSAYKYRENIVQELRRRVYQLAQQHGVIDEMVEEVANDIYNSDDFE
jgi:hypothetical protein